MLVIFLRFFAVHKQTTAIYLIGVQLDEYKLGHLSQFFFRSICFCPKFRNYLGTNVIVRLVNTRVTYRFGQSKEPCYSIRTKIHMLW